MLCCAMLQSKLLAAALLLTALVWTRQSMQATGAAGRRMPVAVPAGAAGAAKAPAAAAASDLLLPLEDAHTLQFDVCNGFTNQRIALMSGGRPAPHAQLGLPWPARPACLGHAGGRLPLATSA